MYFSKILLSLLFLCSDVIVFTVSTDYSNYRYDRSSRIDSTLYENEATYSQHPQIQTQQQYQPIHTQYQPQHHQQPYASQQYNPPAMYSQHIPQPRYPSQQYNPPTFAQPQYRPKQSFVEARSRNLDSISSIFQLGNGEGVVLFNNTSVQQLSSGEPNVPFYPRNHSEQPFKVQRSPDGKLNLVFNDLVLQNPSDVFTPIASPSHVIPHSDSIIFPGSPRYPGTFPICDEAVKEGKKYCTDIANYPQIDRELEQQLASYASFFAQDLLQPEVISQRNNFETEEELCNVNRTIIYPKAGETKDAEWAEIVNFGNYKQGVVVEECQGPKSGKEIKCKYPDAFPNNYRAICKQHYIYRSMVSIEPGSKKVATNKFLFPSCCKCVLVH